MSKVFAQPEVMAIIAHELQSLNSAVQVGNAVAAAPTTGVVPAAADLVSALTAAQFAAHAQAYQSISAQAALMREQLATTLAICAGSYAVTEGANTTAVS